MSERDLLVQTMALLAHDVTATFDGPCGTNYASWARSLAIRAQAIIDEANRRATTPRAEVDVDEIRSAFGEGCRAGWSMCAARVDIFNGPEEILRAWDISVSKARALSSAPTTTDAREAGGNDAT